MKTYKSISRRMFPPKATLLVALLLVQALFFTKVNLLAAELKTPEDFIRECLKNNYEILLARNESELAGSNDTRGAAGMNPEVRFDLGANYAIYDTRQKSSTGQETIRSGSEANSYTANLSLGWTLFDGMKMFATKNKLEELTALSQISYTKQISSSIFATLTAYYDIVKQKKQLDAIREVKALTEERVRLGETRLRAGVSAKTEYLQAKIDYNSQLQNEIRQMNSIREAKINLLRIVASPVDYDFEVIDTISNDGIDTASAQSLIEMSNPELIELRKKHDVSRLESAEIDAENYPSINMSLNYNFAINENSSSGVIYNRYTGPFAGLTLSYPIFKGGNISRRLESSEIKSRGVQIQIASVLSRLNSEYQTLINEYSIAKRLLEVESSTLEFAKENLYLAMERLKLAQTTSIEVRDAQVSYENSRARFLSLTVELKLIETRILAMTGRLTAK